MGRLQMGKIKDAVKGHVLLIRDLFESPAETFVRMKDEPVKSTFSFLLFLVIVNVILSSLLLYGYAGYAVWELNNTTAQNPSSNVDVDSYAGEWYSAVLMQALNMFLSNLSGVLVVVLLLHMGILLNGALGMWREGSAAGINSRLSDTFRVVVYGGTPYFLFQFLRYIMDPREVVAINPSVHILSGIIFWLAALALIVVGLREVHGLTEKEACKSIIFAILALFIMLGYIGLYVNGFIGYGNLFSYP